MLNGIYREIKLNFSFAHVYADSFYFRSSMPSTFQRACFMRQEMLSHNQPSVVHMILMQPEKLGVKLPGCFSPNKLTLIIKFGSEQFVFIFFPVLF